jgi:hypothetical protein
MGSIIKYGLLELKPILMLMIYANDLWEAIERVYEVPTLLDNPTVAQIKNHIEKK